MQELGDSQVYYNLISPLYIFCIGQLPRLLARELSAVGREKPKKFFFQAMATFPICFSYTVFYFGMLIQIIQN